MYDIFMERDYFWHKGKIDTFNRFCGLRPDVVYNLLRWFHGKISGVQAVGKLKPVEDGLFLVRESVRHPGDFVLCLCFSQTVFHYRVIFRDNKLSIDNKQFFYNLIDMIEVRPADNSSMHMSAFILFSSDTSALLASCGFRGEIRTGPVACGEHQMLLKSSGGL